MGAHQPSSSLKRLCDRYSSFIVHHPVLLLLLGLILTATLLSPSVAPFKNIKTDFAALLPENQPSVLRVEDVGKRFGSIKNVEIVFETTHKEMIPALFQELATRIEKLPGVARVRYKKIGYDFLNKNKLLYLDINKLRDIHDDIDRKIQKTKLGSLYMDFEEEPNAKPAPLKMLSDKGSFIFGSNISSPYLTNAEENVFIFEVFPAASAGTSVGACRKFFAVIDAFIHNFDLKGYDPAIKVSYSGGVKSVVTEYDSIVRDVAVSGIISWVLLLIFLGLYFRSLALTAVNFVPLFAGMVWAFGIADFTIGQLNMITAFLFAVLSGLGIENGIHLTTRFFEERRHGLSPEHSLSIMLESTGRPALMAVLTTMCTMLVLLISKFRGFSEFGSIMALGIFMIFSAYIMMLPPLLILLEKWHIIKKVDAIATHMIDPFFFMKRWTKMRYIAPILGLSILFSAVSIWALFTQVKFNNNFESLKAINLADDAVTNKTDAIYRAKSFPALVLVGNVDEAMQVKRVLDSREKLDKTPTIGEVFTLNDLIPTEQVKKIAILKNIRKLLDDKLLRNAELDADTIARLDDLKKSTDIAPFKLDGVPKELKSLFYGEHNVGDEQFVFVLPRSSLDLEDGNDSIAFADDTRNVPIEGKTVHAVSHNLIFADLLIMLAHDMKIVILLAIVSAFVLLWIDFKKLFTATLVIFPLVLGILWTFGVMWITKLDINLFNIVVFPCLIGMSIDNATHIFYRTRETGIENMVQILRLTGNAVVMSVITTVTGFVGLVVAHNRGLYSTGVLAVIGLVTTMASGLVFFPALLQFLREKRVPF